MKRIVLRVDDLEFVKFCCKSIFHEIISDSANIDIVNYCRTEFNFELPGTVIEQRTSQFRDKYRRLHVTIFIVNCCV